MLDLEELESHFSIVGALYKWQNSYANFDYRTAVYGNTKAEFNSNLRLII